MAPQTVTTGPGRGPGPLRRALARLTREDSQIQAEGLREQASRAGCQCIAQAPLRRPVRIRGTITQVAINPRGVNRWLEAILDDGSGEVTLVWMGRRLVRGIEAGRLLEVDGPISMVRGRRTVYNPRYTLLGH
ncbi:OB-fold nucleic acid binding domain-containing protein [Luteococcus peritonei]|uniref:OB-fold nucleic acid binding domain-containing protein n=1 Tax=Luteococcus peritonei TaxID=88874 RepID=A0ABW4RW28_9ACTN